MAAWTPVRVGGDVHGLDVRCGDLFINRPQELSSRAYPDVAERDEVSSALIDRVDAMLQNLEKEIDDVDAKIGNRWRLLDSCFFKFLRYTCLCETFILWSDILMNLISTYGKILVEDIVRLGSRAEEVVSAEAGET
ncbi:hypothetical protein RHMOL_Rhmol09G0008900 [Rhododendron molle]|uniref:Uncharacterized protein n=1 Tax=Rhododendron molle TaxID=49168 RepID=A0ACC0M9Q4_RHOML|nr:hypothetical protein RHMOL_Rhmol09G0008900 [Rhododendron molle]